MKSNLESLIGTLVRKGKTVHYAYVDDQMVESASFEAVLATLQQAVQEGRKVGVR